MTTLAAMVLAAALGTDASAQMFAPTGRDTLRGLPGVEVIVESLQPDIEREGFTAAAIRARVEERLRRAKIRVFASQAENPSPAKPYLYVHVNALPLPAHGIHVVAIQVHLRQTLRSPVTGTAIVNAMTWDAHSLIGVPANQVASAMEEIDAYVDRFIGDWASVQ